MPLVRGRDAGSIYIDRNSVVHPSLRYLFPAGIERNSGQMVRVRYTAQYGAIFYQNILPVSVRFYGYFGRGIQCLYGGCAVSIGDNSFGHNSVMHALAHTLTLSLLIMRSQWTLYFIDPYSHSLSRIKDGYQSSRRQR